MCVNFFGLCASNCFSATWFSCIRVVFDCKGLQFRMCVPLGLNIAHLGLHAAGFFIMMGGRTFCLWV